MMIDPKHLSAIIRAKKKKEMLATPELVDVDYKPDLNPMDMYNMQQQGRIEGSLDTPHKINAEDAEMNEDDNIGISPEQKKRMERLRSYIGSLDLSA